MVALCSIVCRRLRVFYQLVLLDFQMRMPLAMGRGRHGLQHSHGPREALPVLCNRLARASHRDDRHRRAAVLSCRQNAMDLAGPPVGLLRDVPSRRRASRSGTGIVGRVLEPLALASVMAHRPYWKFLWDSNPPTCYSSPSSSGSRLRSSTAEEAAGAAVSPFVLFRRTGVQAGSLRPIGNRPCLK